MSYKTELQSNNTDLQSILDMILALGLVDAPVIITFTINGTSYQAEESMTWAEWCESEYNTGQFVVVSNFVFSSLGGQTLKYNNASINATDVIIANASVTYNQSSAGQ